MKFARQKEGFPSAPQDTWQCTHGMAQIRTQQSRLFNGRIPSAQPLLRPESRVFTPKRCVSPKFASFQSAQESRLSCGISVAFSFPNESRIFKSWRSVLASAKQFNRLRWHKQTTVHPWFKVYQRQTQKHRGGLDCVSRHSTRSVLAASKRVLQYTQEGHTPNKIEPGALSVQS